MGKKEEEGEAGRFYERVVTICQKVYNLRLDCEYQAIVAKGERNCLQDDIS